MTKTEIIKELADEEGLSVKKTDRIINGFMKKIVVTVAKEGKMKLSKFGTFEERINVERIGVNPHTGEKMLLKESRSVKFKCGKAFKEAMNN